MSFGFHSVCGQWRNLSCATDREEDLRGGALRTRRPRERKRRDRLRGHWSREEKKWKGAKADGAR